MKLFLFAALVAASHAVHYTLKVSTSDENQHSSSNGVFYGAALGYNGELVDFGLMDNAGVHDFEAGNTDIFEFDSDVDLGKIGCVIIRAGARSGDAWLIDTVNISSATDDGFQAVNHDHRWISGDYTEAESALTFCRPPYL